ncbi:YtpR family tRNA-binding protein [Phocicoccus pinnipedialis]|uniref:Phenylalanine--tRNA ligase beta subunit n=1 Tax=Phocicoccus pinnipedialis TaxID=110845 RepID=A0A6V7RCK1_9BACL|nr:DUF4479 domain-containing protein [Jeotgalicoccus pinnipedialis]MBP1939546.1 tRNA-binding protein [Jeotgalicoccus pinnipedialis]CAD2074979.1 Phenylalanine--tRNA ligase beta subunit [Jeotgalicoccus pinnipedialis]
MRLTYNKNHVGDVLLVTLKGANDPEYIHLDGVTLIKDNGEIVGLNIFDASEKFSEDTLNSELSNEATVSEINSVLKKAGAETIEPDLSPKFVVGYVLTREDHPDATRLNVTTVDVGDETLQIVCGAKNVDKGQKVVVAKPGAIMQNGLYIKPSELRGVESNGMICSKRELGLPQDEDGIYVLPETYNVGDEFKAE